MCHLWNILINDVESVKGFLNQYLNHEIIRVRKIWAQILKSCAFQILCKKTAHVNLFVWPWWDFVPAQVAQNSKIL